MTAARRAGAAGVAGAALLRLSFAAKPGSPRFYALTLALAATWTAGALGSELADAGASPASGNVCGRRDLHNGSGTAGRRGGLGLWHAPGRAVMMPVLTGAGAFGAFYAAARLARRVPALDRAVGNALRYADDGAAPLVVLTACGNAVAEELFFRGALWSLAGRSHPAAKTALAYTAVTAATRNPALVLAGAVTSLLFGEQRRRSGSVLAPAITHVTWSLLMLSFLPPLYRNLAQPRPAQPRLRPNRS